MATYLLTRAFDLVFQRILNNQVNKITTSLHLQGGIPSGRLSFMLCQEVEKTEDVNFTLVKRVQKISDGFQKDGVPASARGVRFQIWRSQNNSKKYCEEENSKFKKKYRLVWSIVFVSESRMENSSFLCFKV